MEQEKIHLHSLILIACFMAGLVYPSNKNMPWPDNKFSLIRFLLTSQIFWSLRTHTPLRHAFVSLVFRKKSSTTARFKKGTCNEIVWLSATARVSLSLEWNLICLRLLNSPWNHFLLLSGMSPSGSTRTFLSQPYFFYALCFLQFAVRCLLLI